MSHLKKFLFSLISIFFIILFIKLGFWQLNRSQEKKFLITKLNNLDNFSITKINNLDNLKQTNYLEKISLIGYFDFEHQILLDNQFYNHQLGFNILTPFISDNKAILINRGWQPRDYHSKTIKNDLNNKITITAIVNKPRYHFIAGKNILNNNFPLKIQRINIQDLQPFFDTNYQLNTKFYLNLLSPNNFTFYKNWNLIPISSEKHFGYAIQWFLLSFVTAIAYLIFIWRS